MRDGLMHWVLCSDLGRDDSPQMPGQEAEHVLESSEGWLQGDLKLQEWHTRG